MARAQNLRPGAVMIDEDGDAFVSGPGSLVALATENELNRSPQFGRRVILIGDSITGQSMYRVTASAITAADGIATVTASAHNLFPGAWVYIGGVTQDEFNGLKRVITRVDSSTFTYAVRPDAAPTATGSNITVLHQHRFQDRGFFELANAAIGHPFHQLACAGISGATIEEIAQRFEADVLAYAPDFVQIQGGINSILGTTGGAEAASLGSITSAFRRMVDAALAKNITPILVTCLPLSSSATNYTAARGQMVLKLNHWMRTYAQYVTPRVILFDAWQAAVDPSSATGNFATNYSTDGIHLTALGAQRVAAAYATLLGGLKYTPASLVGSVLDSYDNDTSSSQLHPNPLKTGTGGTKTTAGAGSGTNTGNVPDGTTVLWTRAGTGTVENSIESRADGIGSDHQLVVVSGNANDVVTIDPSSSLHSRVSPGDTIVAEVHLRVTGITALSLLSYWILFSSEGVAYTSPAAISGSTVGALSDDIDLVLRTPPFQIPAGSLTNFEPRVSATFSGAGGATIKIGRESVRKIDVNPFPA